MRNIRQNLAFAFLYNAAGVPIAITVPAPAASARYGSTEETADRLSTARPTPTATPTSSAIANTRRRDSRSARCPAGIASTISIS